MIKLLHIAIFLLLSTSGSIFIDCLENEDPQLIKIKSNNSTSVKISTNRDVYNPGQQVYVDVTVTNLEKAFELKLTCSDAAKCMKIFNCNSDCATFNVSQNGKQTQILNASSSGNVILALINTTDSENNPDLTKSFVRVSIGQSQILDTLALICGWIYFTSWSVSFYPQIWLNIKRKSVVGLNFDFIALNVTGFFFYSVFNVAMYYIDSVRKEYTIQNPFSLIPVEANDVFFSVHAFFISVVTLIQCYFMYERQNQSTSSFCNKLLIVIWASSIVSTGALYLGSINVLVYLNFLSSIKFIISFIKYIPQAYFNYQRKSTVGWSIGNILFDLAGGFFSLLQICLINFNYDDWGNITGNLTKFGLGLLSISFDFLFIIQHYVLYRDD